MTMIFASLKVARMISTICCCAMFSEETFALADRPMSKESNSSCVFFQHPGTVNIGGRTGLLAKEDIVRDGHLGHQNDLLMDDADAVALRVLD